ncbi:MAG: hypothetical protein EXQ69_02600 [Acidimicrobiia bacterium]|nr:hypothetical protein [Acidimicrobiia bacterium]
MTYLDHVAIATFDANATLSTLVGDLGGTCVYGGDGYGFRWVQVRLGNVNEGMTIEVIITWKPEVNDFLARFLERNGPAQHHITFKVSDLAATLERVATAGIKPVGVDLSNPRWREAFLVPREAHGTVVQLAEMPEDGWTMALAQAEESSQPQGNPIWWDPLPVRNADRVTLRQAVLVTPALQSATDFFCGLLDGEVEESGDDHTDLVWPGGGRIRLEHRVNQAAGVDRLDCYRDGEPLDATIAGTLFNIASRNP